jgi:hypothetical protein
MREVWSEPDGRLRVVLAAIAAAAILLGLGYLLNVPAATATWPFPVTRITYVFLAAVTIAFAVPVAWVAWTGDIAAITGVGLTVAVAYGLFSLVVITLIGANAALAVNLVLGAAVAVLGAVGFLIGRRRVPKDPRPTPQWVRAAFVVLAFILLLTGGAMLLRVPNILPWNVDLETQQLVGALFVGDAAYFLYAALRPAWPHAAGAWLAFLAYDVILIIPLVNHFAVVREEHRLGLLLYVAVVATTLVLSLYSLLVDRRTRIIGTGTSAPAGARP